MAMTPRAELRVVAGMLTPSDQVDSELAKDVWDVRRLPGVPFAEHTSDYLVNFTRMPEPFRLALKRYLAFRLTKLSWAQVQRLAGFLREFLLFVVAREATAGDYRTLTVSDMDAYRQHLKTTPNFYGRPRSDRHIWLCINALLHFLKYLKRIASPLAPEQDIDRIIWPEHLGRQPQYHDLRKAGKNTIKFVPAGGAAAT
jgi:hypothetical protein